MYGVTSPAGVSRLLGVIEIATAFLLMAMFPANVHAAREGLMVAGRRATPLVWRLPLQLFWIAALWWVRSPIPRP
jgi:uncharacterized membrane protein